MDGGIPNGVYQLSQDQTQQIMDLEQVENALFIRREVTRTAFLMKTLRCREERFWESTRIIWKPAGIRFTRDECFWKVILNR